MTAQLADCVAYEYWTFNGTVPGPMLRVREGDTVEIDLDNAADAGVTHSIDLHAVTVRGAQSGRVRLSLRHTDGCTPHSQRHVWLDRRGTQSRPAEGGP